MTDACIPPYDDDGNQAYAAQSESHAMLSAMYFSYMYAYNRASSFMNPTSLLIYGLHRTLIDAEEAARIVHASLDDEESGMRDLENGIDEAIVQAQAATKLANTGRRRKRRTEDMDNDSVEASGDEEHELETEPVSRRVRTRSQTSHHLHGTEEGNSQIDPTLQ